MIDGILLVDKREGITSYDVIRELKKVLPKGQKIGHAGTLDPFATGLLIILLGKATKLMNDIHALNKEYFVNAKLGIATDTQDITGNVIQESSNIPEFNDIQDSINEKFTGNLSQVPPRYSAKKINGRKAYDMARKGDEFEIKPQEIFVSKFEILDYTYPNLMCAIECSTGTYVRTLIDDLGKELGCFATAFELRRESIGRFNVEDAVKSENITAENVEGYILEIDNFRGMLKDGER